MFFGRKNTNLQYKLSVHSQVRQIQNIILTICILWTPGTQTCRHYQASYISTFVFICMLVIRDVISKRYLIIPTFNLTV